MFFTLRSDLVWQRWALSFFILSLFLLPFLCLFLPLSLYLYQVTLSFSFFTQRSNLIWQKWVLSFFILSLFLLPFYVSLCLFLYISLSGHCFSFSFFLYPEIKSYMAKVSYIFLYFSLFLLPFYVSLCLFLYISVSCHCFSFSFFLYPEIKSYMAKVSSLFLYSFSLSPAVFMSLSAPFFISLYQVTISLSLPRDQILYGKSEFFFLYFSLLLMPSLCLSLPFSLYLYQVTILFLFLYPEIKSYMAKVSSLFFYFSLFLLPSLCLSLPLSLYLSITWLFLFLFLSLPRDKNLIWQKWVISFSTFHSFSCRLYVSLCLFLDITVSCHCLCLLSGWRQMSRFSLDVLYSRIRSCRSFLTGHPVGQVR